MIFYRIGLQQISPCYIKKTAVKETQEVQATFSVKFNVKKLLRLANYEITLHSKSELVSTWNEFDTG